MAQQMETYKHTNPATQPQVAVPVIIPNYVFQCTHTTRDRRLRAAGKLTLIAFYFLLQVREYTHHGQSKRRTQQFCLCDMKFFANNTKIPPGQLLHYQPYINLISLTIDNQKNGKRGKTLSHHAITNGNPYCPVHAVITRTCDMICDGATPDTLICAFQEATSLPWQQVRSSNIVQLVKDAIRLNPKDCLGFVIENVRSHLLQAGGTMAMFLTKHDTISIQKEGCWTSSTFLNYIHNQINIVTCGLAQSMSMATPLST